ncbi:hypothetical protein D7V93_43490, partial [Corallococcus llansteffanensis]
PAQPEALEGAPEALESGAGGPEAPEAPEAPGAVDEEPETSSGEFEVDGEHPAGRPPKPTLH